MKVTDVIIYTAEIVETDEEEFSTYDRSDEEAYSVLMGEAWEPFDSPNRVEKLEAAYQEYRKHNPEDFDFFAEKMHNALGECWYYCNHGSYPDGYENLPEELKGMLRTAVKAVLGL